MHFFYMTLRAPIDADAHKVVLQDIFGDFRLKLPHAIANYLTTNTTFEIPISTILPLYNPTSQATLSLQLSKPQPNQVRLDITIGENLHLFCTLSKENGKTSFVHLQLIDFTAGSRIHQTIDTEGFDWLLLSSNQSRISRNGEIIRILQPQELDEKKQVILQYLKTNSTATVDSLSSYIESLQHHPEAEALSIPEQKTRCNIL